MFFKRVKELETEIARLEAKIRIQKTVSDNLRHEIPQLARENEIMRERLSGGRVSGKYCKYCIHGFQLQVGLDEWEYICTKECECNDFGGN